MMLALYPVRPEHPHRRRPRDRLGRSRPWPAA